MLKRAFLIFLTLFFTKLVCFAWDAHLQKGTLIKVYTKIPLSTEHLEEGSRVYFIVPADVWVLEQKAIEKGDIFIGHVSMLKMPIQGVNAALSITITDLIKPNGEKFPVTGRLIFANKDVLGGGLTNPASYNRTIHPRKVYGNLWGGSLQYVPSGEYEFGSHVGIDARDNIFVQLDEDYYI